MYLMVHLSQFFLEWKMFQTRLYRKSQHKFYNSFYEMMWKNIIQPDRTQVIIRRMRFLCWIPTATNTHSEYVLLIALHGNHICTKAPQCYVLRTLPVLFYLIILILNLCCRIQIMQFPVIQHFWPVSPPNNFPLLLQKYPPFTLTGSCCAVITLSSLIF
jgi:hypothetical protein